MSVDTSEGWGNEVIDSKDRAKVDRPNQDAETAARRMAAEKMGLVKDTHGLRLPEDLWRQMMPAAEAYLEELEENEMTLETQIRQAIARGYCHPDNSNKEMDPVLIEAIVQEVVKTLTPEVTPGHRS